MSIEKLIIRQLTRELNETQKVLAFVKEELEDLRDNELEQMKNDLQELREELKK